MKRRFTSSENLALAVDVSKAKLYFSSSRAKKSKTVEHTIVSWSWLVYQNHTKIYAILRWNAFLPRYTRSLSWPVGRLKLSGFISRRFLWAIWRLLSAISKLPRWNRSKDCWRWLAVSSLTDKSSVQSELCMSIVVFSSHFNPLVHSPYSVTSTPVFCPSLWNARNVSFKHYLR